MRKRMIQILLLIALILSGAVSFLSINSLQGNARVINYTGIVRGATQRLVKEELNGRPNDGLIALVDGILTELEHGGEQFSLVPLKDKKYRELLESMQDNWISLRSEIQTVRQGGSSDTLYDLSESYFAIADEAVGAAESYTERSVTMAKRVLIVLIALFTAAAALLMWHDHRRDVCGRKMKQEEEANRRQSERLLNMSRDLRAPLDDISELMYISDLENYDLLYLNGAAMESFGVTELRGKKCYEVMQNCDTPCSFCNNAQLKKGETITWEKTNVVTGRHYLLKDRLIEWEGRPARLEIAFDMTNADEEKQKLQRALDGEYMLMECVRLLYHGKELGKIVNAVLERIGGFLSAQRAYLFRIRGECMYNEFEWCKEGVSPQIDRLQELPVSVIDRWRKSFSSQGYMVIEETKELLEQAPEEYRILSQQGIERMVAAPMEENGALCGFIGVDNPPLEKLNNIGPLLQTLAYFLVLAYGQFENEKELSRLSYHDTLTSFYNRNRYMEDLEKLGSADVPIGIIYADVNGLKDINDTEGHEAGDRALISCAGRMKRVFGDAEYYRIGGDEFVIISKNTDREMFELKIARLKAAFSDETGADACSVSIGSAWTQELTDASELIAEADAGMYQNKKEYYRSHPASRRYRHHSDELLELGNPEVLKEEIRRNHFIVYVQPKILPESRSAVGAEALIRYRPKEGGLMLPGNFLPILEETKTVSQIDFYVFDFICSHIKMWAEQGKDTFPISVNFSRQSLMQPTFIQQLKETCKKHEVSPSLLGIEFTEDLKNLPEEDLKSLIVNLREAGFAIALDGFGTEYASFTLLTSADFDVLKLDRSMVRDVAVNAKKRAVIESMVDICKKMGLSLVAEGIETEEQLETLRSCGVVLAQGYLFSEPIPIEEYEKKYLKLKK